LQSTPFRDEPRSAEEVFLSAPFEASPLQGKKSYVGMNLTLLAILMNR
jgi:hypothetical protein